ncbi:HAD domain-containing protein [Ramlibacter tataouinensis]|uniref:HAD domain-containing protein n=1 Tax=Ramlibacter tataouinensis TaxID=94132 RepID=UPI0022F3DAC7|nr:HAD domain-containing protein [Ramlibacter tataouinensis]WBY02094.1 HAD domain-containing protein [Ramlibacter tataouinensis]
MRRVLYLDFDGVLHPATCEPHQRFSRAASLAQALAPFACELVISSSWRFAEPLPGLLRLLPAELARRVTGCTGEAVLGRHAREREILAHACGPDGAADWRALDDSSGEFSDHTRLVACDPDTGFNAEQARRLAEWLGA